MTTLAGGENEHFRRRDLGHHALEPGFPSTDEHPVVGVNIRDAFDFCAWLTEQEKDQLPAGWRYPLPNTDELLQLDWKHVIGQANVAGKEQAENPDWPKKRSVMRDHEDEYIHTAQ